jgi:hypothetical protein
MVRGFLGKKIKFTIMSNCLECGAELINTPGKRPKQFCNVTHRSNYWQKQKRLAAKADIPDPGPVIREAIASGKPIITDAAIEYIPLVPEQAQPDPINRTLIRRSQPPVMPPGLSPLQQQAWKAEERKRLQEERFK